MKNKIEELIKQARKERSYLKLQAYQSILSAIQERETRENKSLSDDEILTVIEKEKKAFDESAELFKERNPVESKNFILKSSICEQFLPEKIHEKDYPHVIRMAIQQSGAESIRDMGKVMAYLKEKYGKSLDMGVVSAMVKEQLSK
jgi:uncharacterized protein